LQKPDIKELEYGVPKFWGWGNLIERLLFGIDDKLMTRIADSEKWDGNKADLAELVAETSLLQPTVVPIREAIDWIHASIYTTIKAVKFSHFAPACGGAIELAVITTDRPFRWVQHKALNSALL